MQGGSTSGEVFASDAYGMILYGFGNTTAEETSARAPRTRTHTHAHTRTHAQAN